MVTLDFRPLFRSAEDRAANRREQVRKAQRTFRERRDQYLRQLERQVGRLQLDNAKLITDVDQLRSEVSILEQKLLRGEELRRYNRTNVLNGSGNFSGSHSLAMHVVMSHRSLVEHEDHDPATVWIESHDGKPHRLLVVPSSGDSDRSELPSMNFSRPARQQRSSQNHLPFPGLAMGNPLHLVAQLDMVIVAMEFVLKLESPCLPHLHGPATQGDPAPQGHMHTVSATLLCCVSSESTATVPPSPPDVCDAEQSWTTTRSVLARLLETSSQLPIERLEMTPVQAWSLIRQHIGFEWLTLGRLQVISDKLLNHVKCYGFGAVIKHEFLNSLLLESFS